MKKLNEGGDWEKEWADAFEHASLQPSENVWNGIDGNLANKELRKYKKRALFFQWVAAASVFFSMCGAAWLFTQSGGQEFSRPLANGAQEMQQPASERSSRSTNKEIKAVEPSALAVEETATKNSAQVNSSEAAGAESTAGLLADAKEKEENTAPAEILAESQEKSFAASFSQGAKGNTPVRKPAVVLAQEATAVAANNQQASIDYAEKAGFIFFDKSVAAIDAKFQKVWLASDLLRKKEELPSGKFWLGAVLASSSFDPNFQESSTSLTQLAQRDSEPVKGGLLPTARVSQWNEEPQQQLSINGGVQAAARIGKKWVLQGGVQYGSYRSAAMAGTYADQNSTQAYPLHYANFSYDKVQMARAGSRMTAPVSALNTFEFISVPLQVGYVVFDKKFSLLLSPGISTEFFLRNQLSDQDSRLSTYTVYSGEEAPFETLHLKGIFGAQLFYKFGDNYMISLEPSYQRAISDFSKSSSFFESRPSNIGLAAGFRYIIR